MPFSPETRRALRLMAAALRLWPRDTRDRDGAALLHALGEELEATDRTGWRWIAMCGSETLSVAAAGVGMRWSRLRLNGGTGWADWAGDLRFAFRSLRRSPGFTATVGMMMALGIGANAAVFGVVDRVLLRPPPFDEPGRLVLVWNAVPGSGDRIRIRAPDVVELREHVPSLGSVAFLGPVTDASLESVDGSGAAHLRQAAVSTNLFRVLGVEAALGRGFLPGDGETAASEGQPPNPAVAVLSWDTWTRILGSDPEVIGRELILDGRRALVVGIMPAAFRVPMPPGTGMTGPVGLWLPIPEDLRGFQRVDGRRTDQDSDNTGAGLARMVEGTTLREVDSELTSLARDMRSRIPEYAAAGMGFSARAYWAEASEHLRGPLEAMFAGVVILLIIACLNVSTVVLARGARRAREMAVRSALGAGRGRILRHLVTESLVLSLSGSLLAVAGAAVLSRVLATRVPYEVGMIEAGPDFRMILFVGGITIAVILVSGLAPAAVHLGREEVGRTGSGPIRAKDQGPRARRALLTGQVAISVTLLLGTFLLLKTAIRLSSADPGFDARGALTFDLSIRIPGRYPGPGDRAILASTIIDGITRIPGVRSVGLTTHLPLSGRRWEQPYGLPGQPPLQWEENRAGFRAVTSGLFTALGVELLEGRAFSPEEDLSEERRVAVVDRRLANRIAPRGSAVGATIGIPLDGSEVGAEVVGVVANVRHDRLDEEGGEVVYVPYRQEASREVSFVVRTDGDPSRVASAVRAAVLDADPQLTVYGLRTLESYVDSAVAPTLFAGRVLGAFALLALLALGIGLYGVMALEATTRTREIGLRMAIGARPSAVMASILWGGLQTVAWGAALGSILAVASLRFLRPTLYGTRVVDPWGWLLVLLSLAAVAAIACWIPSHRAAAVDPTVALRGE